MKQQDKIFFTIGGLAVVTVASVIGVNLFRTSDNLGGAAKNLTSSSDNVSTANASTPVATTTTSLAQQQSSTPSTTNSGFKDGTYNASTTYRVPHGTNSLTAKITVSSGKVTAVNVDHNYTDSESGYFINSFESELKSTIVGQPIDGLSPSRIGGATLTTNAFSDALTKISNEARA